MSSEKNMNSGLKAALEYGPIAAFFISYMALRDRSFVVGGTEYAGFIVTTAMFIPLILISTGLLWWLSGKIAKMQLATAVLVTVFGGLTVWLNDESFFKMKPTIIYLLFAGILGFGLLRGKSYLQYVMEGMMPLKPAGWMLLTRRLALFFAGLAIANEVVWRNMSTDTWVNFKTFGLPLALFVFFMAQAGLFKAFGTDEDTTDS